MRRDGFDRLGGVEIIGEFRAVLFLAGHHLGNQLALVPGELAQLADQLGILGEIFHENLPRTVQRGGGIGHAFIRVHIILRSGFRHQRGILQQRQRQGFEARLAGDLRFGAALFHIRPV